MKVVLLSVLFSLSSQAIISNVCSLLFKKGLGRGVKSDLKRLESINKLDNVSNFLRRQKSNPEVVEINQHIMGKIARVDNQLFQGRYAYAHRSWRGLFRKVEVNLAYVKKQQEIVNFLQKNIEAGIPVSKMKEQIAGKLDDPFYRELDSNLINAGSVDKYLTRSHKEIRKRQVAIGNNYHEYKLVRNHLERLSDNSNCKDDCNKAIIQLFNTLGTGAESVRLHYPNILKGARRPSWKAVTEYAHSTPMVYEVRQLKEMLFELKAVVREMVLQRNTFQSLFKFIELKFPLRKSKIMRIFNIVNDGVARTEHFPNINDIVRKNVSAEDKYYLLRDKNVKFESDEMLVSFSRRVDTGAAETWSDIKAFLKEADDPKMVDFLNRMEKADEKAKVLGDLSLNSRKSNINKLAIILTAGSGGYLYLNYGVDNVEEGKGTINDLIENVSANQDSEDGVTTIVVKEDDNIVIEEIIEVVEPVATTNSLNNNKVEIRMSEQEVDTLYEDTLDFHEVMKLYEQEINVIQEDLINGSVEPDSVKVNVDVKAHQEANKPTEENKEEQK